MSLERTLDGFRYVQTYRGDTLQRVAAREMGDASRWFELADINGLIPPYITDDPELVSAGVMLSGDTLLVPATGRSGVADGGLSPFGSDIALSRGELSVDEGDLSIVSGVPNLVQSLAHRLQTDPGDILFHARYGCAARSVVGKVNGPTSAMLAAGFVKRAILSDSRVAGVRSATVRISGDVLSVEAEAETVDGNTVSLEV